MKCPKCKKKLDKYMAWKFKEYQYCSCNHCGIKIEDYFR